MANGSCWHHLEGSYRIQGMAVGHNRWLEDARSGYRTQQVAEGQNVVERQEVAERQKWLGAQRVLRATGGFREMLGDSKGVGLGTQEVAGGQKKWLEDTKSGWRI